MTRKLDRPEFLWGRAALYALLTGFALAVQMALPGSYGTLTMPERIGELVQGSGVIHLALILALIFYYQRLLPLSHPFLPSAALLSLFFALCLLFGQSFEATDSWAPLLGSPLRAALSLVMAAGYTLFFFPLVSALFHWLDRRVQTAPSAPLSRRGQVRFFFLCLGLILLFWLPYLLLCWPGSVTYDGMYQLEQFFGFTQATNHHPWLSTLLMGWIVSLGGDNLSLGVFLYVLFQSLVCAAALAGICWQVRVLAGRAAAWLSLAFFALVPNFGGYAQMFVKDTLFFGMFAAFFLCVVLFLKARGKVGPLLWAGLLLTGLLCALLRNNGLYIVVPTLFLLIPAARSLAARLGAAGLGVGVLAVSLCFNQLLLPALGVVPGSVREVLSLPFQQTARYVQVCGDTLSEEEIAILDRVLDYETLVTSYDPRVSDPVKNTYHGDSEALKEYLGLWLRQGLRRPDIYLEATLNSMFGYFLPGYRYGPFGGNYFFMQESSHGLEVEFAHPDAPQLADAFSRLWSQTPGLELLNAPGTFSWMLVLTTTALLRRRTGVALVACLPLWLALGSCCVSPVNALVRYMLPIMAAAPLLLAYAYSALNHKGGTSAHG